jgi:hypothetical protein
MPDAIKPYPRHRTKGEATCWLFIAAVNEHVMKCQAALFPNANPTCRERCCPTCCTTCSSLRWYRDEQNGSIMRLLNRFSSGLWGWQMADGSVDWAQIEAHWSDDGADCHNKLRLPELLADLREERAG